MDQDLRAHAPSTSARCAAVRRMSRNHRISRRHHNAFQTAMVRARGTFCGQPGSDLSARRLLALRALGEPGQYVVGRLAGYDLEQIAALREWTPAQAAAYEAAGLAWLRAEAEAA
jgi:hypothetical protein